MNPLIDNYLQKSDAVLISNIFNITYLIGDFGFSYIERECFLLITKNKKFIITDKRYSENIKNKIKDYIVLDNGTNIFLNTELINICVKENIKTLGIEEYDFRVDEYKKIKKIVNPSSVNLATLRMIKTSDEIDKIKKACYIGDEAFKYIINFIKSGISEIEIQRKLEHFFTTKNAESSFKPIVAFGINSAIPHHLSGEDKLKKNQIVLLDYGVKINGYCSDMTRTIFFGKSSKEFLDIYTAVYSAQKEAINFVNTDNFKKIKMSDIDKLARDFILKSNYPTIPHSVGHGIGLEVHEAPFLSPKSKTPLQNNMVFSVEPGIYIKNYGGVRIEDLVVVNNNKLELISHANREIIFIDD